MCRSVDMARGGDAKHGAVQVVDHGAGRDQGEDPEASAGPHDLRERWRRVHRDWTIVDEMAAHAFGVGLQAGKEAKGFHGLMDGHPAAIERGASGGARGAEEFGFQREIDYLGNPEIAAKQSGRAARCPGGRAFRWAWRESSHRRRPGSAARSVDVETRCSPKTELQRAARAAARPGSRSRIVMWPAPIFSMA